MHSTGCSAEFTEPFALRVIGESMLPEFKDNDIIIVDPGHPLCADAFVVIEYENDILFGKYVVTHQNKWLEYLDPQIPAVPLLSKFTVKGVVIQRSNGRRKYLKHYNYTMNSHNA